MKTRPGLFKRILLATDLSDEAAQEYAVLMASVFHAELNLVYVLEIEPSQYPEGMAPGLYIDQFHAELQVQLKNLVDRMAQRGISAEATQLLGPAAQGILEFSKESETDFLILGSHQRSVFSQWLKEGIVERVLKGAPCPIMVVPSFPAGDCIPRGGGSAPEPQLRRLLIPVDYSDCSIEACEYAIQLALPFHAGITLLHVRQDIAERGETAAGHEMEDRLQDITDLLRALDLPAQYRLYLGDPRKAILRTVEEDACDLIVMGSYPRPDCSTLFARTATQTVLRHLPCPTVIVKKHKKQ